MKQFSFKTGSILTGLLYSILLYDKWQWSFFFLTHERSTRGRYRSLQFTGNLAFADPNKIVFQSSNVCWLFETFQLQNFPGKRCGNFSSFDLVDDTFWSLIFLTTKWCLGEFNSTRPECVYFLTKWWKTILELFSFPSANKNIPQKRGSISLREGPR